MRLHPVVERRCPAPYREPWPCTASGFANAHRAHGCVSDRHHPSRRDAFDQCVALFTPPDRVLRDPLIFHCWTLLPFLAKPCACSVRFLCQGSPLRSDERQTPAPLTARTDRRLPSHEGHFAFHALLHVGLESKTQAIQSKMQGERKDS